MKKVILTLASLAFYLATNAQLDSKNWEWDSSYKWTWTNNRIFIYNRLNVEGTLGTSNAFYFYDWENNKSPLGITLDGSYIFNYGYTNINNDINDYSILGHGFGFYKGKNTFNNDLNVTKSYVSGYMGIDFFAGDHSEKNGSAMTLGHNKRLGLGIEKPIYMIDVSSYDALGLNLKRKEANGTEGSISMTLENATASKWNLSVGSAGDFTINNNATTATSNALNIKSTGEVVIGAWKPKTGYKLSVKGKVACEELTIELSQNGGWGDFVFDKTYDLKSLEETEKYISENKHLPGIPAAVEIEENGLSLGEMQRLQMIKIEELTLHLIELKKQNESLKSTNAILEQTNEKNQSEIAEIKSLLNQLIIK